MTSLQLPSYTSCIVDSTRSLVSTFGDTLTLNLSFSPPSFFSNLKKALPNNITLRFCVPYHFGSVGHKVFQYLFETTMGCLVPFSLINTCYSSVICRLQTAKFQRRGQGSRLILMIICAFAIFWLPYHIVNVIEVAFDFTLF